MQMALFPAGRDGYRRDVTEAPTPWIAYVRAAKYHTRGVAELARRTGIAESTIHRWISGRVAAGSISLDNIVAVARAIGDDPDNALRAAGRLPAQPANLSASPGQRPPLVDILKALEASGLPPDVQLKWAAKFIAEYHRGESADDPQPDDADGTLHRSA